jgi:hypothetical protein
MQTANTADAIAAGDLATHFNAAAIPELTGPFFFGIAIIGFGIQHLHS